MTSHHLAAMRAIGTGSAAEAGCSSIQKLFVVPKHFKDKIISVCFRRLLAAHFHFNVSQQCRAIPSSCFRHICLDTLSFLQQFLTAALPELCTLYNVHVMALVQCTLNSIQYTIYSIQYTIYSIQYTIYSIQYTVYSIQYTVTSLCLTALSRCPLL